jgi:tetratricopeptide (TPR) repeat protein
MVHLERARSYEIWNDPRAAEELRAALRNRDKRCIDGFLKLSQYLARGLRFGEAARTLEEYILETPRQNHTEHLQEVQTFRHANRVKKRLENARTPDLQDLIYFARIANGYGRRTVNDALPYAERAVKLYPSSVEALMLLADLLMPTRTDEDKVELLLNQAVAMDTKSARVHSSRGWFFLFFRGRPEDAEKDFQTALELDGKDRIAWKGLGYFFMFKGQKKQALSAFTKYLSLAKPGETNTEIPIVVEQLKEGLDP